MLQIWNSFLHFSKRSKNIFQFFVVSHSTSDTCYSIVSLNFKFGLHTFFCIETPFSEWIIFSITYSTTSTVFQVLDNFSWKNQIFRFVVIYTLSVFLHVNELLLILWLESFSSTTMSTNMKIKVKTLFSKHESLTW